MITLPMWVGWAVLLVVQNFAFTAVSRGRNSGSIWYHGVASFFSNAVWFAQFFIVFNVMDIIQIEIRQGRWGFGALAFLVYTAFTMTGSLVAHHVLRNKFEKGNRKVGA